MDNIFKRNFSHIITVGLRFSVLVYLISVVYPYILEPGFENEFGNWTLRWGLIILISLAAMGIFILKRNDFMLYGFFLVFLAGLFQVFTVLISDDRLPVLFLHLYVLATSLYFATKSIRSSQRIQPRKSDQVQHHKHHRSRKTSE